MLCYVGVSINVVCGVAGDAHPPWGYRSVLYDPRAPFSVVCPRAATRALYATEAAMIRPRAGWTWVGGARIGLYVTGE